MSLKFSEAIRNCRFVILAEDVGLKATAVRLLLFERKGPFLVIVQEESGPYHYSSRIS
jgi:hypothetical protein